MSEYDYANGEEYESSKNSHFKEEADLAFETINEKMTAEKPYSWDDICQKFFDIDVPDFRDIDAWVHHLQVRHSFKEAVNRRARRYRSGWQLYSFIKGESIIKHEMDEMVSNEADVRIRSVAGAYGRMSAVMNAVLTVDGIGRKYKKLAREMRSIADGARIATLGMISQSKLPKEKKQLYMEFFVQEQDDEEDDEE